MDRESRIYVGDGSGFIGGAIVRELRGQGYETLLGGGVDEPDLTDARAVDGFFRATRPEYLFMAAGKILGIGGNQRRPAELMFDNLVVTSHMIHSAFRSGVKKLLYLGSGCSYPKLCPQPMRPETLMSGQLESTSEFYATAKIAGLKLCEAYRRQYGVDFISAIPANPYGIGDDFNLEDAHVIGALIRRMHEAREGGEPYVEIWGSVSAVREFIYVDDLADACVFVMQRYSDVQPINLAGGTVVSVRELAGLIRDVVGYQGELWFNEAKPDGMPVKVFDSSALEALGWRALTPLRQALAATYEWFLKAEGCWRTANAH